MIREFTQSAKDELYLKIDAVSNDGFWETIGDFFSDIGLNISYWFGELSIDNYIDDVDSYHEQILDAKDTLKTEIDEIFQAVSDVDTTYTKEFSDLLIALENTVNYVESLSDVVAFGEQVGLENAIGSLSELENDVEFVDMMLLAEMVKLGLAEELTDEQIEQIKRYIESEVNELGRDVIALSDDELKLRQEIVVDLYRALEPESAEKFDELFNSGNVPLDHFDCYNIMYLVYTSEDPFRTLFIDSLGTYTLGDVTLAEADGCFYSSNGISDNPNVTMRSVNLCQSMSLYNDVKGPYVTFFHECGHAIDDRASFFGSYSNRYMDKSNYDVIYEDVYTFLESEIEDYCEHNSVATTEEEINVIVENVLNAIKNNGDVSGLTATENSVYDNIVANMKIELNETSSSYLSIDSTGTTTNSLSRSGISDVYGGITNNVIVGERGHWGKDDDDDDGDGNTEEYTYWYSLTDPTEPTGKQEREMWAHYFSYGMVGHEDAVNDMHTYLQNTMDRYDQMANDMIDCF